LLQRVVLKGPLSRGKRTRATAVAEGERNAWPFDPMPVRGPAATAGIEVGDVITALDDVPITGVNDLHCRLAAKQPGDVVSVRSRAIIECFR
jgi:membrane-associated protease RseP (regulator of RpoE activity)